jgi:hypothetical protein
MKSDLKDIFRTLKKELQKYEPRLTPKNNDDSHYDLWLIKELEIAGRKRKELYYAGIAIQSSYVGFYFMPVYGNKNAAKLFGPELMATLKGKACFHIKNLDNKLLIQIRDALKTGTQIYKKMGWA